MTENTKNEHQENEIQEVYQWDEHGHYTGPVSAQYGRNEEGQIVLLMPPRSTTIVPVQKEGYWLNIKSDKSGWEYEKIPTNAAECLGIYVKHEDQCDRAHELRKLFEKLCEESEGKYRVSRDEDLTQFVEKVPEKTPEELEHEQAEEELHQFDEEVASLKDRMAIATLTGDEELISQLRQEYNQLITTGV